MSILDWYRRVQYTAGVGTHPVIESLKKQAKQFQRQYPKWSLMQAQNKIAQDNGFTHWHHAQQTALNYKNIYSASLPSTLTWSKRCAPVFRRTKDELRHIPARWIGLYELGPWHVGQKEHTQRLHTLVTGEDIGPVYLNSWLEEHAQKNQHFIAWLNVSAWPSLVLHGNTNRPDPLLLRLGTSIIEGGFNARVHAVEIYWQTLSEMHAWVNVLQPELTQNAKQAQLLTDLLAWLWLQPGGHRKTGGCLGVFLHPQKLLNFPGWKSDPHNILLLAGELACMFRNAQPFNAAHNENAECLTIDEWLHYASGIIILDDGAHERESARRCVQAWIHSNIGHRLGIPLESARSDFKPRPESAMHWYFANIPMTLLSTTIAAQCRALGIAITYFYNVEPKNTLHSGVKENAMTKLVQSPQSPEHVWFFSGYDNATMETLRITGPGINDVKPMHSTSP